MANHRLPLLINRRWLLLALLFIILSPLVSPNLSTAALLKDIRIGEYVEFTRIVFEMDVLSDDSVTISRDSSEELNVLFKDTRPDLVRKIPVERSPNIQSLRIVSEKMQLLAGLKLALPHKKVTTFQLKEPPRMVVDVYWGEPGPEVLEQLTTPQSTEKTEVPAAAAKEGPDLREQAAASVESEPPKLLKQPAVENTDAVKTEAPPSPLTTRETKAPDSTSPPQELMPPSTQKSEPDNRQSSHSSSPSKKGSWLQYYLVIALVIITIVILSLLVLMLISKYRWTDDSLPLSTNEYLKRQDQRLASLDERIKEQLKRYDEV